MLRIAHARRAGSGCSRAKVAVVLEPWGVVVGACSPPSRNITAAEGRSGRMVMMDQFGGWGGVVLVVIAGEGADVPTGLALANVTPLGAEFAVFQ